MSLQKIPSLKVWQQVLVHAFLVWFFFNLYDTSAYAYRVAKDGPFLFLVDGTPLSVWDRFLHANLDIGGLALLLLPMSVELNYHWSFKNKSIKSFLGVTLGVVSLFVLVLVILSLPVTHLNVSNFLGAFLFLIAYFLLYAFCRHVLHQRISIAETRQQHSQAELNVLKAQLNPHFFFNTLNSLYGTALMEKAERTAQSVEQLSGIMRYVLTEAQQDFTDISFELKFLGDYLQLQQMRLPLRENIQIQTSIAYDGLPARIAPLLLIPFVENAFKYGISVDHACFVRLSLTVKNQQLTIEVENRILPDRQTVAGVGTGIAHARKRLELLYPNKHRLDITQADTFLVKLYLEL